MLTILYRLKGGSYEENKADTNIVSECFNDFFDDIDGFRKRKKETCREDSIQLIEQPIGNDLSHNYVIEESVVNDEGVEWTRVDVYSVDENGVRAAIGYAEYSWFVSD